MEMQHTDLNQRDDNKNNNDNNNNNNSHSYRVGTVATNTPQPTVIVEETKGRYVSGRGKSRSNQDEKQYFLSENDETILSKVGITVTEYLGEGFFGIVWKGQYTTTGILFFHSFSDL